MKNSAKKLTFIGLLSGLVLSFSVALNGGNLFAGAAANETYYHCKGREASLSQYGIKEYWTNCNGHTTIEKPSAKEYIEFEDAKIALPELDSNDDRYIAPLVENNDSTGKPSGRTDGLPTEEEIRGTTIDEKGSGTQTSGSNGSSTSGNVVTDMIGDGTGVEVKPTTASGSEFELVGYTGNSKTVIIPEGVTTLDNWNHNVFNDNNSNAKQIEIIVLPASLQQLNITTISNLPNLRVLIIRSKKLIGGFVQNCPKLETVYLAKTVETVEDQAFMHYGGGRDQLKLFTEHASKPAGWSNTWNVASYGEWPFPMFDVTFGVKY